METKTVGYDVFLKAIDNMYDFAEIVKYQLEHDDDIREWHRNLWDNIGDEYEWREFVEYFRETLGLPRESKTPFDVLWQYRILNHEDYDTAVNEMVNLIIGVY